jgi:ferredoxin
MLRQAGIKVESSCRDGICGTCETRVLAGTPDHRDSVLSPEEREEGDYMMVCVSRAVGDVLELDI